MRHIPFAYMKQQREPILTVEIIDNTSLSTWTSPPSLFFQTIFVECWGGGGRGGTAFVADFVTYGRSRGGGGGGGAYSNKMLSGITESTTYNIQIGAWQNEVDNNTDTWFIDTGNVLAKGGLNGKNSNEQVGGLGTGGAGGSAALSIGDFKRSGGNGASAIIDGVAFSGGGGGSANTDGNGSPAIRNVGGISATGTKPGVAGNGGNGRSSTSGIGSSGNGFSTGGGGGLCLLNTGSFPGGSGVKGLIRLTYYI